MRYAAVALDVPLRKDFVYSVPANFRDDLEGSRVMVPFGRKRRMGVVLRVSGSRPAMALQVLELDLDGEPLFDAQSLDFLVRCADALFLPAGRLVHAALPPFLRRARRFKPDQAYRLAVDCPTLNILSKGEKGVLELLKDRGALRARELPLLLRPSQRAHVKTLWEKGILGAEVDLNPLPAGSNPAPEPGKDKLRKLRKVARDIAEAGDEVAAHLLCAAPCGERLEVCLQLLRMTIRGARRALVLAPDSASAEEWARAIGGRLPELRIGLLHPGRSGAARVNSWLAAARGHLDVLVGTRDAALAPLPGLRVAIVAEPHSLGFLRNDGPCYSAVELARMRCRESGAKLVLCGEIPPMEDYRRAAPEIGSCAMHRLDGLARTARAKPEVHDSRGNQNYHGLAAPLVGKIVRRIRRGGRVVVLVNRREWAAKRYCPECGCASSCPECRLALTVTGPDSTLRCSLCGYERKPDRNCPECGAAKMRDGREGAMQIERGLRKAIPDARFLDADSNSGETVPDECDVVIARRMDLGLMERLAPALVVAAFVDERLMSLNYRSTETLLGELLDLGRLCAGASAQFLVQSRHPGHPLLQAFAQGAPLDYWDVLLAERKATGLPPFGALGAVRASARLRAKAHAALEEVRGWLVAELAKDGSPASAMSVVDSSLRLRAGVHRVHFAVRAPDAESLRNALARAARRAGDAKGSVRFEYDSVPWRL